MEKTKLFIPISSGKSTMGVFSNSDSPEEIKTSIRDHLKNQSAELEDLKAQVKKLKTDQSKLKE